MKRREFLYELCEFRVKGLVEELGLIMYTIQI